MALDALNALRLLNAHYNDLCKSNPGFLGNLCLKNYALLNEALMATDRTLGLYRDVPNKQLLSLI